MMIETLKAVQYVKELKPGEAFTVMIQDVSNFQREKPYVILNHFLPSKSVARSCIAIGIAFEGFPVKGELPGWLKK